MMEDKKYKINYFLSTFLRFLVPFIFWNWLFTFFPQMLNWAPKLKVFYENDLSKLIFLFLFILVITFELLIDALIIQKRYFIKALFKNKENKEAKKIFWTYIILELLFFIPILSILSNLYYNIKKEIILNFSKNYSIENKKNLENFKWFVLVIGFLIPFSLSLTLWILVPQVFWWNEGALKDSQRANVTTKMILLSTLIILIISYVYFEIVVFKRNQLLKNASKNDEKMSKVYLKWKWLHILLIIPWLSMSAEIYYLINKKRIENQ